MIKYLVLLRGINVGGKNKLSMKDLKGLFEQNGFVDVITYINSGNIIFKTDDANIMSVKMKCEELLKGEFGLDIAAAVLTVDNIVAALHNAPDWWGVGEDSKHNAIYVIPPVDVGDILREIGEIKPEYEKIDFYGKVIFWSAPVVTYSRTRLSKIVGTSAYDSVTIRNANTTKKLAEMCAG